MFSRPRQNNQRAEKRVVCTETEIITRKNPNSRIKTDSSPAIIHDRSESGLGVFCFSSKPRKVEEKLEVEGGGTYELRWSMQINRDVQYFGLKLVSWNEKSWFLLWQFPHPLPLEIFPKGFIYNLLDRLSVPKWDRSDFLKFLIIQNHRSPGITFRATNFRRWRFLLQLNSSVINSSSTSLRTTQSGVL